MAKNINYITTFFHIYMIPRNKIKKVKKHVLLKSRDVKNTSD
jgi:hypothetical protein